MQVVYVALLSPTYIILIIIALVAVGYIGFMRPYIRTQRLDASLLRIADAFPVLRTCFEQSALISSALLLEESDAVIATGTGVVCELAPAMPTPPGSSVEDLQHAMQKALAANLKGISISAFDGVLNAVEKQTCGSVLEFWRQAAQHWTENPQHAAETAMQITKVALDGSIVNISGLLQHFAEFGKFLGEQTASEASEKLHLAVAATGAGDLGSVDHSSYYMSATHIAATSSLHPDSNVGAHLAGPDPDSISPGDVDLNIDDLSGGLFDGVDPTMLFDGIPVITIVRSAFREIRLLASEKTTAADSLKNWVLDVGTGATGLAIGLAIGNFVLPGIGGFIGAALGGFLARIGGNYVKAIPCKKAVAAYQGAYGEYQLEFAGSIKTWYGAFEEAANDSRKEFIATFSSFTCAGHRPETNKVTMRLMDAVADDYGKVVDEIRAASSSSTLIRPDRWYHLLGGVAIEATVRVRAKALADARIQQMEEAVLKMRAIQGNSERLRFVASLPCSTLENIKASFATACAEIDELVKNVFAEFQIWIGAARIAQAKAFKETADVIGTQRKRHERVVSGWKSKLEAMATDAKRECEKLGG